MLAPGHTVLLPSTSEAFRQRRRQYRLQGRVLGALQFLGQAKVVGHGGEILARTWSKAGIAMAELDVAAEIAKPRQLVQHLNERKPAVYRTGYGEA